MSAAALLQVEELVTGYGQLRVVRGMSFTLARDEILAVIGANGAGKTTLLNALVGQLPAWSGRVLLEAHPSRAGPRTGSSRRGLRSCRRAATCSRP